MEEEGESEQEEEDIFELEGQTEHLHLSTPRQAAEAQERLQGRGGWEGAAGSEPTCLLVTALCCPLFLTHLRTLLVSETGAPMPIPGSHRLSTMQPHLAPDAQGVAGRPHQKLSDVPGCEHGSTPSVF